MHKLQRFLLLAFSISAFTSTYLFSQSIDDGSCENLSVEITTKDTSNGKDGEITLTLSGGSGNYSFNYFGEGTKKNRLNASRQEGGLAKGKYIIVVEDKKHKCKKVVEATIR